MNQSSDCAKQFYIYQHDIWYMLIYIYISTNDQIILMASIFLFKKSNFTFPCTLE